MSGATNRILEYLDYKGISKYKFYKDTKLSNGFLDKNRNIGSDKCEIISNSYPEINIEWVITGKGKMLKSDNENNDEIAVVALIDSVRMQKKIDSLELKIKRLEALNESYREEIKELKKDMATLEKKSN